MIASLFHIFNPPSIAVRVANDDTTFDPLSYPNLNILTTGKVQGKIRIVHSAADDSKLGLISTRVWITKENDKEEVAVQTGFENKTFTFTIEGPNRFSSFNIYHETTIQIPHACEYMGNLRIDAPNTSLSSDALDNLQWDKVHVRLSASTVALQSLYADSINIRTSNSSISGAFDAGNISLATTNGAVTAKLVVREPKDGRQSQVMMETSNAHVNLHVDATPTTSGLWMETKTKNGRIAMGTLLGPATTGSYIGAVNENGTIDFSLDASQTGQPLDVYNKTMNGNVVSSIMVPHQQPFKGHVQNMNGSVAVNLTEEFRGQFTLETLNSSTTVEGSDLRFDQDETNNKSGLHGKGLSEIKVVTMNAPANLRFYREGESLAADSKMEHQTGSRRQWRST
ncbi:hypothetical protein BGX34_007704 [Mortierella sp. NVP85]|nr:hypothetical protein BGX34_007704 [Mortierella sp. NVP85]